MQPDIRPMRTKIDIYTALLSQEGTDAPTANILLNEEQRVITFNRVSAGQYWAELPEDMDATTTWFTFQPIGAFSSANRTVQAQIANNGTKNVLYFTVRTASILMDTWDNIPMEIRFYNEIN